MSLLILLGSQAAPAPVQGNTFLWYKDNGTWRLCSVYLRDGGIYKYTDPSIKISGTWS